MPHDHKPSRWTNLKAALKDAPTATMLGGCLVLLALTVYDVIWVVLHG